MEYRFRDEVEINLSGKILYGELAIPLHARGIVIFAHGSGSSRNSPRNQMVARYLNQHNTGTFLFDLLTLEEDKDYQNRFDIELLTRRLLGVTSWLEKYPAASGCSIGYFGASTGSAAALKAAARRRGISAVVSRGGRPDLAMDELGNVEAPSLLLVGSLDHDVLLLNRKALEKLECEKKLDVIEGASHLFEERGTMEQVCERAGAWFEKYLEPVASDH